MGLFRSLPQFDCSTRLTGAGDGATMPSNTTRTVLCWDRSNFLWQVLPKQKLAEKWSPSSHFDNSSLQESLELPVKETLVRAFQVSNWVAGYQDVISRGNITSACWGPSSLPLRPDAKDRLHV